MDTKNVTGAVLPHRPVFDKIAALAIVVAEKFGNITKQIIKEFPLEFREDQHPSNATWQRWEREGKLVIDVGHQKYQLLEKGSASTVMVSTLDISSPVLLRLAEIADKNNRTGYLKESSHSVVWILREMYKLGYQKLDVVRGVLDVISMWLLTEECLADESKQTRSGSSFFEEPALTDFIKALTKNKPREEAYYADFTIGQYAINLWLVTDDTPEKIIEKCNFFLEAESRARAEEANLDKIFDATPKVKFADGRGVLLHTCNEMLGRWCLKHKNYSIVAVRTRPNEGNVVILTRGSQNQINLRWLAGVLVLLEHHAQRDQRRGRWFYDERINALLNGTVGHHVPATKIGDDNLVGLISLLVFGEVNALLADMLCQQLDAIFGGLGKVDLDLLKAIMRRELSEDVIAAVIDGTKK